MRKESRKSHFRIFKQFICKLIQKICIYQLPTSKNSLRSSSIIHLSPLLTSPVWTGYLFKSHLSTSLNSQTANLTMTITLVYISVSYSQSVLLMNITHLSRLFQWDNLQILTDKDIFFLSLRLKIKFMCLPIGRRTVKPVTYN